MIQFDTFQSALPLGQFLDRFAQNGDRDRWTGRLASVELAEEQLAILKHFTRRVNVLFLAGAWCGDCAFQCPILEKFAEVTKMITVRYLDRDEDAGIRQELSINGGHRVPVAIFFSEDGHEVARFGERTLTQYRRQVSSIIGDIWGGLKLDNLQYRDKQVVDEWLRELERVQWILRLSPRLRKLHGD
jgi:thiol-disulfide isomerase/thioredoxin